MTNSQTQEINKKIARQTFEALDQNNPSLLDSITNQEKYKLHFPGSPEPLNYSEAKKLNAEYYAAFPDVKTTIDQQIAEGDFVVSRVSYQGTHKGELQGTPASNKKVRITGISIVKVENGKVVEQWDEFDSLGMMQQIGAVHELESH